jgi:hypothetical protein
MCQLNGMDWKLVNVDGWVKRAYLLSLVQAQRFLYTPPGLSFRNSTLCGKNAVPYCAFVTKRFITAVVAGCTSVGAGGGGWGVRETLLKVFFLA